MANGWTPERKAKQSELIRQWKPWQQSTGAKTVEGKKIVSRKAVKYKFITSFVNITFKDIAKGFKF